MTSKRRPKKSPLPPDVAEATADLDRSLARSREEYQEFVASIRDRPCSERAEGWLSFVARHQWDYGDQEALVYLRSRGHACAEEVANLIARWRRASEAAIGECARGIPTFDLETGASHTKGATPLLDVSRQVRRLSSFRLRNFWSGRDEQEATIDATMLRTVEWCDIGGFDDWWYRLAREQRQAATYGIEMVPAGYMLFSYARSPMAIELLGRTLTWVLEMAFVAEEDAQPWEVFAAHHPQPGRVAHLGLATSISFALEVLGCPEGVPEDAAARTAEFLLSCQRESGAWPTWIDDPDGSVETTAQAVHALALAKPRGWEHSVRAAEKWLLSVQQVDGRWTEPSEPDPVWLSVLVLDALSLARGDKRVTCLRPGGRAEGRRAVEPQDFRFQVALSFPGEHRRLVALVADHLADRLGRENVFYDRFFEAELARPNLDTYLQKIYHEDARLIVLFICGEYNQKEWCGLEWRAIRDLIKGRHEDRVMVVRLDAADVPGLFGIDGYVDMRDRPPEEIATLVLERLDGLR